MNYPCIVKAERVHGAESARRISPEIALTRFQMAELLLEHYPDERDKALEHLNFALEEFKEMKMQPYIEKARALKDDL